MTYERKTTLEHAFKAREQLEFAKQIRDGLRIPSSPEEIAATASRPLPSNSRYLTLPERRRLTNAIWKDDPSKFYLALAFAIPLNHPPEPYKESKNGVDCPTSGLKRIHRREKTLHGQWTYLNREDTPNQYLNAKNERYLALALALSTWGTLRTDQDYPIEDGFALAVAAMRAESTLTGMLIPTPRFIEPVKQCTKTKKVHFPKANRRSKAISELHRNAAIKLIHEFMDSEMWENEKSQYTLMPRSRKADNLMYAEMVAKATEKRQRRIKAKHLVCSNYFNTTLNMHAANFPENAAAGELFYRATGGNLPLLIPAAHATRRQWLRRPERASIAESPQRDILDALVRQYDLKPFLEKCRIYFHCWLRGLTENRLQYQEEPHIYMSYTNAPQDLLYRAPAYWPGPYQGEESRDALRRVNMTTLIPQCMLHAERHCRLKHRPDGK